MTVSLHPPYKVECDRCGAYGPASEVSPGFARADARLAGWGIEPGETRPLDVCPNHEED